MPHDKEQLNNDDGIYGGLDDRGETSAERKAKEMAKAYGGKPPPSKKPKKKKTTKKKKGEDAGRLPTERVFSYLD